VKNVLYATDFLNNQLEIIGGDFKDISTIPCAGLGVSSKLNSSVTTDPYSWVWSVSAVNGKLIVTFADLLGPLAGGNVGGGAVDVFNTDGVFQYQIDANDPTSNVAANATGRLENPWGVTLAPANFGMYSNDLLVGNVWGPGHINAYKPDSNGNYTIYAGQLSQPDGTPIAIKGLWDMEFGDGTPDSGKTNQLFFVAGPNHPGDSAGGLFGVIHAAGDQGLGAQVWISPSAAGSGWSVTLSTPAGAYRGSLPAADVTAQQLTQPMTTGDGSTAGTTGGSTGDGGGSTGDSIGAFDSAAGFMDALSTVLKKGQDTGSDIGSNQK
jgi:hypothetical protein